MLDVLLPERCAICLAPGAALCGPCRNGLTRLSPPVCERCGSPERGRCGAARSARGEGSPSRRPAPRSSTTAARVPSSARGRRGAAAIWRASSQPSSPRWFPGRTPDSRVPVPGDPERAWRRGDVPPRRLALELGRRWGMPVSDLLERTRPLPHQRGLSLDERLRERARQRRPARIRGAENGVRRRRRLHVGRDRRRLRVGAPPRGSPPCERRDPRAGRC